MRKIGSINGSYGNIDGQPVLGREGDCVENFPYHQELAGGHQISPQTG